MLLGKNLKILPKILVLKQFLTSSLSVLQNLLTKSPENDLPKQMAQLVPFGELLDVKKTLYRPFDGAIKPK